MTAAEDVMASPATVAVLGPGGVGGLAAGLLARAGHRVTCLAGPGTAETLSEDGLHISSAVYGDFSVPVEAGTELSGPVDLCLVTVKATALPEALEKVPAEALGSGLVVPLLNGFEHVALLRDRYPAAQVAAATIMVESTRVAPGRIEHSGLATRVQLASRTTPAPALERLAALLGGAGFTVGVRDDEDAMLWDKLCFLAPMALLSTRYGLTVGGVRTERRAELLTVLDEITSVARAATGAPIHPEGVLKKFDAAPAGTKSSMQRDAEAGRALELDAIGGAVLRSARKHGVEVPTTARIVAEVGA